MFVAARTDVVVGIPSFRRDEIFFRACALSASSLAGQNFFFARLSRLLYSERYLPPPFPLLGFMSVPRRMGEKFHAFPLFSFCFS